MWQTQTLKQCQHRANMTYINNACLQNGKANVPGENFTVSVQPKQMDVYIVNLQNVFKYMYSKFTSNHCYKSLRELIFHAVPD